MKRSFTQSLFALLFILSGSSLIAQDIVKVSPGYGVIEDAIYEHGGGVIYQLEAGGWYGLNSIIEVSDTTLGVGKGLVIIGEETDGLPATIQIGNDVGGAVFGALFSVFSDLTLKNLFLSAMDFSGVAGSGILSIGDSVRVEIDNCVFDPAGVAYTFSGAHPSDGSSFFLTNSLIMNNGHMQGPNDGGWYASTAWDTLWVENNTFVSSGQDFIGTQFHNVPNNKFIWINHNTFLWHDVWIKKSYNDKDFFFTNNLMHDISIFSQIYPWGQFFPDYKKGNTMLSLTCIDTLELSGGGYETLPSERKFFWEYNLQYNSPELRTLPELAKQNGSVQYLIPMKWDDDTPDYYTAGVEVVSPADSSRETRILDDDVNWPYMKYDNNWYDIDPLYTDQQIYATNDSMIKNVVKWYGAVVWGNGDVVDGKPSYMWEVDKWAGTPNNEFPAVWPRFDGTYTNAELLTASIEGLPLGDLNWFPAKKAQWLRHKEAIEDHILALNESRYVGVGIEKSVVTRSFTVYPNPASNVLNINSDAALSHVTIYDVTGKMVERYLMDGKRNSEIGISPLKSGVYFIEAESLSGETFSTKFVKK
ncbi:MAG: T9SS type A sorting domain-containing protein [Bacteroidota bacterium]